MLQTHEPIPHNLLVCLGCGHCETSRYNIRCPFCEGNTMVYKNSRVEHQERMKQQPAIQERPPEPPPLMLGDKQMSLFG